MAQKNCSMSLKPKQRHCKRAFFCLHQKERSLEQCGIRNVHEAALYGIIVLGHLKNQTTDNFMIYYHRAALS